MRIIGGTHKSRRIHPPKDAETTRPITDRVKVALFDRLWDAGLLDEGNALDIFSGTGSLGLEALSRGLTHCTFIERDHDARQRLERNLSEMGLKHRAAVMSVNATATSWLASLPRTPLKVVFCDPPYAMVEDQETRPRVVELIAALLPLMEPGGVCMLRTPATVIPEAVDGWMEPKRHTYGAMTLHFFQKELPGDDAPAVDPA
jgi:16S rRNA (guanine966-N2)-methyltransferase